MLIKSEITWSLIVISVVLGSSPAGKMKSASILNLLAQGGLKCSVKVEESYADLGLTTT